MANLAIIPKWRSLDANGNPLAGGKLYTYEAGTSTPLATYTTAAGDVANANPVVLNASGEASVYLAPGVSYKFELRNASDVVQWTEDNVYSGADTGSGGSGSGVDAVAVDPGGRLTLSSGTPVTTANTSSTTVYWVPRKHNRVPLFDGEEWSLHSVATELSQALSDATKSPAAALADKNYDYFIWYDEAAETERLSRGPPWTSNIARGTGAGTTELERRDGRLVNKVAISNGPAAQRGLYVGTVRVTGAIAVEDTLTQRYLWNMYDRFVRPLRAIDATDSWSYTTATTRQARASTDNQVELVRGLDEDEVSVTVNATAINNTGPAAAYVAIGLDSTTTVASGFITLGWNLNVTSLASPLGGFWRGHPGLGSHALAWLERGNGSSATVFYGDNGSSATGLQQSGIHGSLLG